MGQQNSIQIGHNASLTLVQQFPIGKIHKQQQTQCLYFVKQYAYTSEEAYQQAFIKFSAKLTQKNQNILSLQKTNTKVENTFCSTFYKIILIFQYIDYSLADEIQMRNKQNKCFQQKQIWSVLFHCTLAIAHLRRTQGIQHSAIGLKDIKLSQDGTIKIIPTEMIGIYNDHDQNQGTTKKLAMTILSCILMKQVSNQSNQYLQALIDKTKCSKQLKKVLYIMIMDDTTFQELQEYLFKLSNDQNDSVLSGVSTPVYSSHKKSIKESISKVISQQPVMFPKNNKYLTPLNHDQGDQTKEQVQFQQCEQYQNPDENDQDKVQQGKSSQNIQENSSLNDEFHTFSTENNVLFKTKQSKQRRENQLPQQDVTVRMTKKISEAPSFSYQTPSSSQNLYTDPKLLDLIKKDLQEIQQKSKASYGNSNTKLDSINFTKPLITQNQSQRPMSFKKQNISNISSSNFNIKPIVSNNNAHSNNTSIIMQNKTTIRAGGQVKQKQKQKIENPQGATKIFFINKINEKVNEDKPNQETFKEISNIVPKRTKEQECFGNILDEQASFKKAKSKKSTTVNKQSQVKKNLDKENCYESTQTKRMIQSHSKSQTQIVDKVQKNKNSEGKLIPQSVKSSMNIENQAQMMQFVTQTYQKGQYKGYKFGGLRHGTGTFYYKQGGKYMGEWRQNKMNGKGTLYYPNDSVAYQGNWKDDQLHGYGTLYNEQVQLLTSSYQYQDWSGVEQYWIKYEGEFNMDNKQGKGKLYLSNGQIFQGNFKQDMVDGEGVLSRQNGSRVRGIWRANKLIRLY